MQPQLTPHFRWQRTLVFALTSLMIAIGGCTNDDIFEPAVIVAPTNYYQDAVQPIFDAYCVACHGPNRADFGIDLSSYDATMQGDRHGEPTVVPFNRPGSSLYRSVATAFMPIASRMPTTDVEILGLWIDAGAPGPLPYLRVMEIGPATDTVPFSYQFVAEGGSGGVQYALAATSELPNGLSLSGAGLLSGTAQNAAAPTPYELAIELTDLDQHRNTEIVSLRVVPDKPTVPTPVLPDAQEAVPYALAISVEGGVPPYAWTQMSGSLPAGLALSVDGRLSGTPDTGTSANSPYYFSVEIVESFAQKSTIAELEISVTIAPTMSFAADVLPLLAGCTGCHSSANQQGGLSLSDADAYAELAVEESIQIAGQSRVIGGNGAGSVLIQRLEISPDLPGAMPPGGPKLAAEDIQRIRLWIDQGAANN